MLGAGIYPITLAEMESYSRDADEWFKYEEHERLKEFLALHPESGDVIPGLGGVRKLRWPIKNRSKNGGGVRIVYYFRDLNMPLYLLALYREGERIKLDARSRREVAKLIEGLVAQHGKGWARIIRQDVGG
jgi:hypothetical protein